MSKRREEKQEVLQMGKEYFLDYDLFTVEEIIKISQFFYTKSHISTHKADILENIRQRLIN